MKKEAECSSAVRLFIKVDCPAELERSLDSAPGVAAGRRNSDHPPALTGRSGAGNSCHRRAALLAPRFANLRASGAALRALARRESGNRRAHFFTRPR